MAREKKSPDWDSIAVWLIVVLSALLAMGILYRGTLYFIYKFFM